VLLSCATTKQKVISNKLQPCLRHKIIDCENLIRTEMLALILSFDRTALSINKEIRSLSALHKK
jgi:hypothetical protein